MAIHPILPHFHCTASSCQSSSSPRLFTNQHSTLPLSLNPNSKLKISPRPQRMMECLSRTFEAKVSPFCYLHNTFLMKPSPTPWKRVNNCSLSPYCVKTEPLPAQQLEKECTFSHTQLSKYLMYGSVRCFCCCVFLINASVLVLCPVRSGLDKCLVICFGYMVSKEGCEKSKGSHCSLLLLIALVFTSKSSIFMLPGTECQQGKGKILFHHQRTVEDL